NPVVHPLNGLAANGTTVVAACNVGTILKSTDGGSTWAGQASGTGSGLDGAVYGNGLFVLTGANGTILTSPDGTTWTARTSGTSCQRSLKTSQQRSNQNQPL
ncbi:MAG TPA: hypothetical protein PLE80_07060, partial [Opitutaceae bacterium]|nr:hypothetical protein [Opitutaceae bacterium]